MKKIFFILMLVSLATSGWTQQTNHQFSSVPETSRFQIVQSEIGVSYTFNIDRYTGSVFLLVKGSDGLTWQLIDAQEQAFDEAIPDQVNYQVFTSGIGVKFTFLLNVNTGITWQLMKDSDSRDLFWAVMK